MVRTTVAVTWRELAEQALADPAQIEPLLARARAYAHAFLLDRLRQPEVAQDLTQETLADVALHLRELRAPDSFLPWLRTLALNRCRQYWRRPEPPLEQLDPYIDRLLHEDAYVAALRRERWRELRAALEELPETSRLILLLHVTQDLTYAGIADLLELPEPMVRVRAHRARRRLQALLRKPDN